MNPPRESDQFSEDRLLAQRSLPKQRLGDRATEVEPGISTVPPQGIASTFEDLKQHLRDATRITICGIATQPLVRAVQAVVTEFANSQTSPPWESILYLTPAHDLVLSTNTRDARLGPIVQRWSAGLGGIRHAARSAGKAGNSRTAGDEDLLQIVGIPSFYVGLTVLLENSTLKRSRIFASVGPRVEPNEPAYLQLTDDSEAFGQIATNIERVRADGRQVQVRYVSCVPEEDANRTPSQAPDPLKRPLRLTVSKLHPSYNLPSSDRYCHPISLVAVRSKAAGEEIALLKQRTFAQDEDSLGRLSLLSEHIHELDLASGLKAPFFPQHPPDQALDGMWKAARIQGRPYVPHSSFVLAAQREIAVTCGLDVESSRFRFCGYETIRRMEDGVQLAFCVFELVLYRHEDNDELERAETWNSNTLVRVNEQDLFTSLYEGRLNRFLTLKADWLRSAVYSHPVTAFLPEEAPEP